MNVNLMYFHFIFYLT